MHAITMMKSHWLLEVRTHTYKPHIQWNSPVHSQLKHFSGEALHFEYENQPIFEEGKRLSSRLLDSLRLNDDDLPRDSLLSQHLVSKEHLKRVLHVPGERKHTKRTKKHQQVGRVSSENSDDYDLKDHELFEFDDVSLHDVDAGDESPENVLRKLKNFSSMSKNYHSKSLRARNISANKNIFAQMELDEQPPALGHGDSDCNIAKIGQFNVINVPIESPEIEKQVINPRKQTEVTQKTTELTSLEGLNLENGVDGADTHRTCKNWFMSGNVQDEGSNIVSLNSQGKGDCQLQPHKSCPLGKLFDPLQFARIYNLVALRVPLAESKTLAYRLQGHLLNWPRISNIARVEGDDMGWDRGILWSENVRSIEDSVFKAVYGTQPLSGCLTKRINSAKLLNSHQYSFLDHMSKPDMKALQQMKGPRDKESAKKKQHSKRQYTIKLGNSDGIQKLNPGINCWKGPFRLLLLDPRYAQQYELPMAVQMLLKEHIGHGKRQRRREVVPCNLIIFYNYWSMGQIIRYLLPKEVISPLQIKHLGHIALLQLDNAYSSVKHLIGRVILDKHQPKVKTVVNKCEPLEDCGHPSLEILAGNHSVVTSIIENDMQFLVNLSTVHWDWELAAERRRLVQTFNKKDIVCDVFAGAGALTLLSARKVWRVFANDPITDALKYLARNTIDNKLQAKVELYNLDCSMFVKTLANFKKPVLMTQIVFSLPTSPDTLSGALKGAFNRKIWPVHQPLPMVHVYGYSHMPSWEKNFCHLIVERLQLKMETVELHVVKSLNSTREMICASFRLPEQVAFYD